MAVIQQERWTWSQKLSCALTSDSQQNRSGGSGVTCKSDYTFTSLGGGGVSQVGLNPGNFLFKSDYSCNLLISASCSGGSTDRTECQSKTLIFHLVATEEE